MAQIIVNDEKQEVTLPLTLAELIKINKVFQPEMVTIQVNEDFVEREDYEKIQLKEGDSFPGNYAGGEGARFGCPGTRRNRPETIRCCADYARRRLQA